MTADYETAVQKAAELGTSSEDYDFHARRLVEMAGYIVMGYLLLLDANRAICYKKSCEVMIAYGQAENAKHKAFIDNYAPEHLAAYKISIEGSADCGCAE